MLECTDCGTLNTAGATMCVTCGGKHLLTDSEASHEPPSGGKTEIRRLGRDDGELALEAISQLKAADWEGQGGQPKSLTSSYLARFLQRDDHYLIVAINETTPVGYLLAYELSRVDRDQNMMLFYEIGVAESQRQRGVGTALTEELKTICRERNIMKLWVETNESNAAAMRLFHSTGSVRAETHDQVQFGWTPDTF